MLKSETYERQRSKISFCTIKLKIFSELNVYAVKYINPELSREVSQGDKGMEIISI